MQGWARIARDIYKHYDDYGGFVVLHGRRSRVACHYNLPYAHYAHLALHKYYILTSGTDTMAYTASALSFMLENLGKSVVLTGLAHRVT
jgi:L-asparaginase/Glu-tRNA(Gln) amidotransferase subunit D